MRKLKQIIWYICVISCTIFVDLSVHYIRDKKEQKIEAEQETLEKQNMDNILREGLYITGDSFEYTPDTVIIDNMRVGENKLMIDLYFFNQLNEFGISLTKEEALKEYENFCSGSGSYDKIIVFCEDDWSEKGNYINDLREELNILEPYNWYDCWDKKIEEVDSEQLATMCDTVWEHMDYPYDYSVWWNAQRADYGGYDLEWRLLDIVDEWRCSIDENGDYYFKFDGGKGTAYCNWGTYTHPYDMKQLYITKIIYDGGLGADEENFNVLGNSMFRPHAAFDCYLGEIYEKSMMKNVHVPDKWVFLEEDEQNPCFRYGNIQVSIELKGTRIKRVILSVEKEGAGE